jgi:steroid delta-isomerase-like uncharacterized protein
MRTVVSAACVCVVVFALGCSNVPCPELEANKELVNRFGELLNATDWEGLEEIVAEDFVRHSDATPGPPITSREAFIELQESYLVSMPDQKVTMEKMIAEGDYVAVLATYSGTQTGPMGELPPTGTFAEAHFLSLFRIENGMIAELWVEWDNLTILEQLGLFPPPSPDGLAQDDKKAG